MVSLHGDYYKCKEQRWVSPRYIMLLTQCYYQRGTRFNVIERFCLCSLRFHLNVLTFFPLTGGCSEGLDASIFSLKQI